MNPCRDIKYNKTRPDTRYVTPDELELVMRTAREHGGIYLVAAMCLRAAYMTVSRPDEMRKPESSDHGLGHGNVGRQTEKGQG